MMSTLVRRGLLAALLATSVIAGCKCGNKTDTVGCSSDQQCVDQSPDRNPRWYCDATQTPPACAEKPQSCDTAADCCPSQVCNQQGHFCADKFTPCTGAGSCPVQGQVCQEIGVFPHGQGCTFQPCGAGGACGTGTICFNQFCVGEPPCGGGCRDGKVCVTETNSCSLPPKDPSCSVSCPNGKELVLGNPTNIFDTCTQPGTCECDTLPPLQVHDVARHSSMTSSGSSLYVSTYDGEYGDLVVQTFEKGNLTKPGKSEWLDGVPKKGSIGGDPNGPRHGITDHGPNVGEYTSIVASNSGDLFVSYYDVDNGDLKFIARYGGPAAPWTAPITIDGSTPTGPNPTNGDVGLYSSIALTSGNLPAIAYFRRGNFDPARQSETGPSTALVYAVAKMAQPTSAADWTVVGDVETALKPRKPCADACAAGQVCVLDNAQPSGDRCTNQTSSPSVCANPVCGSGQDCVNNSTFGSPPVCATPAPAQGLTDLPLGTGLMPSLKFMDDRPVIAYYDSINRELKAVQALGTASVPNWTTPYVIDGGDLAPAEARDTGRFPSLAIGYPNQTGGRIAIAFPDLTSQQLLVYQSNTLAEHQPHVLAGSAGRIHVVDDGTAAKGAAWHPQTLPGVQSSAAFTASGKIAIAYQDGTTVSLNLAVYDPNRYQTSAKTQVRALGASGFWPHLLLDGTTAYLSSATIRAATAVTAANRLFIDTAQVP